MDIEAIKMAIGNVRSALDELETLTGESGESNDMEDGEMSSEDPSGEEMGVGNKVPMPPMSGKIGVKKSSFRKSLGM